MMIKNLLKNRKSGFTLVEMMISMAIFSMIMTLIMSSVHSMTIARIKNMNRLVLTDQLYLFSEQLFTTIKNGGTIDYEEYWNRKTFNTDVKNWHYEKPSGVGNYGKDGIFASDFGGNFYYCRSQSTTNYLKDQWCASDANKSLNDGNAKQEWNYQRFGQYALQFWDYNGNKDNDSGDQDGKNGIIGDEDDFNLWNGPEAIMSDVKELYLIDKQGKKRTFLRWNWENDPNRQNQNISCKAQVGKIIPDDNCIANIQILKMNGSDLWLGHNGTSAGAYDGNIDTWTCEEGWNCSAGKTTPILSNKNVATGSDGEWINLFPNSVTVRNFKIEVFPKKDPWLSAAAPDCDNTDANCVSPFIHPYVRITLELGFSHGARRSLRGENPTISVSTTISLDDFR